MFGDFAESVPANCLAGCTGWVVSFCADAPLAQLAEQLTLNQWVPGSSPGGRTNKKSKSSSEAIEDSNSIP